jgi:reactive intermediate/imine deaminase
VKQIIETVDAPSAIGTYSQAVRVGDVVYLSGQIPLLPDSMTLVTGEIGEQVRRVFANLSAVAREAGGALSDIVKLTVFLTDLADFQRVNEVMAEFFQPPYPARAVVGASALPKGAQVEIEAIMVLGMS